MSERSVSRVITRKGEKPGRDRGQRGKVSSGMVAGPGSNKCGAAGRCHRIRACQRSRCRRRSQLAQNSWRPRGGVNRAGREGHPRAGGPQPGPCRFPATPRGARRADPAGPTPPPRTRGCLGKRKRRGRRSLREEEEEVEEREVEVEVEMEVEVEEKRRCL